MSEEDDDVQPNEGDDDPSSDPIIDQLLQKYSSSRTELETDLEDISKLKKHMDTLFPQDLNFRNKFVLEEKIKSTTGFYSTILSIRQEINKSLSNEIDIRRKLKVKTDDTIGGINIRALANEIETVRKEDDSKEQQT